MKIPNGFMRHLALSVGLTSGLSASAHGLVAFYQVGGDRTEWVRWDTYAIDSDSLVLEGGYLEYKTIFITTHGGPSPESIKVDCKSRRRAVAASTDMYATYAGTVAGEEVKTACSLAVQQGLMKQ